MEPLLFGQSDSALYGVYHPPESSSYQNRAILLCYPGGHEYMRIHRAFRQLASLLNSHGFHVFRFDYFGTGNSAGEHEDIDMSRWIEDAENALDEIQSISGCRQVDIVGLRLGSLVAASVAAKKRNVKRVVLWEPMSSGQEFVDEMSACIAKHGNTLANFVDSDDVLHFNGYPFPNNVINSIKSLNADSLDWSNKPNMLLLSARGQDSLTRFKSKLEGKLEKVDESVSESGLTDWNSMDAVGGIFLPLDDLNKIVGWLSGTEG